MGEIMNSRELVKSDVPERVSICCLTCGTSHDTLTVMETSRFLIRRTNLSTYVSQRCRICAQDLHNDHITSKR